MPVALFLLFLVLPPFAALSLEIGDFLLVMILFCVIAGLSTTSSDSAVAEERPQEPRCARSPPDTAKSLRSSRSQTLPKLS